MCEVFNTDEGRPSARTVGFVTVREQLVGDQEPRRPSGPVTPPDGMILEPERARCPTGGFGVSHRLVSSAALMICTTLVAAACFGSSGNDNQSSPGAGDSSVASPQAALSSASDPCSDWQGLRHYALEARWITAGDTASLPGRFFFDSQGEFQAEPMGIDGVNALVDEMTSGETFCDLSPSPTAKRAVDRFLAAPDPMSARDILFDAARAEVEPLGYVVVGAAASGPVEPRRRGGYRDLFLMASALEWAGADDDAASLRDTAVEMFGDEAKAAMEGADNQDLIEIAAAAQLLGQDDLAEAALDRRRENAKAEVKKRSKEFVRCSEPGSDRVSNFVKALARADLLGVSDVSAEEAGPGNAEYHRDVYEDQLHEWEQRQVAAAEGEIDSECQGRVFESDIDLPAPVQGSAHVRLVTCDGENWNGELTGESSFVTGDGRMDMEQFFELHFGPMSSTPPSSAEQDLNGRIQTRLSGDGFSGVLSTQAMTGHATFSIVGEALPVGTFEASINTTMVSGQITVDGETMPVTLPVTMGSLSAAARFEQAGMTCGSSSN